MTPQPFTPLQSFGIIVAVLAIIGGIWLYSSGKASTFLGVTLTTNGSLETGLLLHWTFDAEQMQFSSSTNEVQDISGSARHGNLSTDTATSAPTILSDNFAGASARLSNSSPTVVFTDTNNGWAFWTGTSTASTTYGCYVARTTDGGSTWSARALIDSVNATDCIRPAVWYDGWTPGSTGTYIHILTFDEGADDLYYTRLDTRDNSTSTTVAITAIAPSYADTNGLSITVATNGTLYATAHDASAAGVVFLSCTTNCTAGAAQWTARTSVLVTRGDDWPILMPLSGSTSVMQILADQSGNAIYAYIYDQSANAWGATSTIATGQGFNTTYRFGLGATINTDNGDIYLAYASTNSTLGTDDDFRTAVFSRSTLTWAAGTDILTNSGYGLLSVKLAYDPLGKVVYAYYLARTTAGTAATARVFRKISYDGMSTWQAEQGPYNSDPNDKYGLNVNIISYGRVYGIWKRFLTGDSDIEGNTLALRNTRALTPGPLGAALALDGVDDYVATSTTGTLTGVRTIALWVKFATTTASQKLVNIDNTDQIETNGTGAVTATSFPGTTAVYVDGVTTSTTIAQAGEWRHIVITDTTGVTATKLELGRVGGSYGGFAVDDVRLYNKVLTTEEVRRLYELGATTRVGTRSPGAIQEEGLVGYWPLDGAYLDLGSTTREVLDASGNGTHLDWLAAGSSTVPGIVGQAIEFGKILGTGASKDYLSVEDPSSGVLDFGTNSFSFMAWFRTASSSDAGIIVAKKNTGAVGDPGYRLQMVSGTGDDVEALLSDGVTQVRAQDPRAARITQDDTWHHAAAVVDRAAQQLVLYVDGQLRDSLDISAVGSVSNTSDVRAGLSLTGAYSSFPGAIDEVRVYNKALSAQEILRIYNVAGGTRVSTTINQQPGLQYGLIAHYTFDGKDVDWASTTAEVKDRSGRGNHGNATTSMGVQSTAPGMLGQALTFSAPDDMVEINSQTDFIFSPSDKFSITFWVNRRTTATEDDVIEKIDPSNYNGWAIYLPADGSPGQNDGSVGVFFKGSSDVVNYYTPVGSLLPGMWYHVSVVYGGSLTAGGVHVYINGVDQVLDYSLTGSPPEFIDVDFPVFIGADIIADPCCRLDGTLDDVRVYNRILSADEAKRLYEMGR